MTGLAALVLAGTRAGGDPLAAHAGVSHKALIEIGGRTMVERVVSALAAVPAVSRVVVAIEDALLTASLPAFRPGALRVPVTMVVAEAGGPSATVAASLGREGTPLLVSTADNALLRPAWVEAFMADCPDDVDIAAGLALRADVEAAAPDGQRTWLRFSDGDYSGCNLFLLRRPAARGAIELWREIERDRKQPLRMMKRLGFAFALRYRLGRLSSADAATRLGELAGARVAIVRMNDGRAAIDVDKPSDLALVRRLVADDAGTA